MPAKLGAIKRQTPAAERTTAFAKLTGMSPQERDDVRSTLAELESTCEKWDMSLPELFDLLKEAKAQAVATKAASAQGGLERLSDWAISPMESEP